MTGQDAIAGGAIPPTVFTPFYKSNTQELGTVRAFVLYGTMIIDHNMKVYRQRRGQIVDKYNGAFYYSQEIGKNIIPRVDTDRNWITVNVKGMGCDHAIVFIHNNKYPEFYEWLHWRGFKDLVLVCGVPETMEKVKHLGTPIYLPLNIDTQYVTKYRRKKTKDTAFVGRRSKRKGIQLPDGIDYLEDMERDKLLASMAEYKNVYAVGRCAIEARALGCNVLPYDPRYPDPTIWKVLDNKDAAAILQWELDQIDGKSMGKTIL